MFSNRQFEASRCFDILWRKKKSNNFSTGLLQTLYRREKNIMYILPDGTNCLHLFSQIETFYQSEILSEYSIALFVKPKTFESPPYIKIAERLFLKRFLSKIGRKIPSQSQYIRTVSS